MNCRTLNRVLSAGLASFVFDVKNVLAEEVPPDTCEKDGVTDGKLVFPQQMLDISAGGDGPDIYVVMSTTCNRCRMQIVRSIPFFTSARFHFIPTALRTDDAEEVRALAYLLNNPTFEAIEAFMIGEVTPGDVSVRDRARVKAQVDKVDAFMGDVCRHGWSGLPVTIWLSFGMPKTKIGAFDAPGSTERWLKDVIKESSR